MPEHAVQGVEAGGGMSKPKERTVHPVCGRSWMQHGNRSGHCARCHETFEGITLFDAHQRIARDGTVMCLNPARMWFRGARLKLIDGSWRGPGQAAGQFRKAAPG
jgi:hypothetical protein